MQPKQVSILLAVIVVAVTGYVLAVRHFQQDAKPQQNSFAVGALPADRLEVHAQIMNVTPTDDQFEVRFELKPFGKYGADSFGRFSTDMTIILMTADGYHSVHVAAGDNPGIIEKEIELDQGSPHDYPFDRYTARLGVATFALSKAGRLIPVPTVVNYEDDLGNYTVVAGLGPKSTRSYIDVRLDIRRSSAILTFSIMMYAAITLVSGAVLIFTLLIVLRRSDSDFGMMLWSGAMLFALPAVRSSLPDSPPLGTQADFYIFMWAMTIVALSMVTLTGHMIMKRARGETTDKTS
jgi:hypothetical protein